MIITKQSYFDIFIDQNEIPTMDEKVELDDDDDDDDGLRGW